MKIKFDASLSGTRYEIGISFVVLKVLPGNLWFILEKNSFSGHLASSLRRRFLNLERVLLEIFCVHRPSIDTLANAPMCRWVNAGFYKGIHFRGCRQESAIEALKAPSVDRRRREYRGAEGDEWGELGVGRENPP